MQRQILEVTSLSTILNNKQVVYINGSSLTSYLLTDSTFANIVITPPFAPMSISSNYNNKLVMLNTNGLSFAYSTNNGITFTTLVLPIATNYVKCTNTCIWFSNNTTTYVTRNNGVIFFRTYVQATNIRGFNVSPDNSFMCILLENSKLICQNTIEVYTPSNFAYLLDGPSIGNQGIQGIQGVQGLDCKE